MLKESDEGRSLEFLKSASKIYYLKSQKRNEFIANLGEMAASLQK